MEGEWIAQVGAQLLADVVLVVLGFQGSCIERHVSRRRVPRVLDGEVPVSRPVKAWSQIHSDVRPGLSVTVLRH